MKLKHFRMIAHDESNFMNFECMFVELIHFVNESLGLFYVI